MLGMLVIATDCGEGFATVFGGVMVVADGVVEPIVGWFAYRSAIKVPASWSTPRTYRITEEGLESLMRWSWSAVRSVQQWPEAYLFWQDGGVAFDLPREPMTPEQEADLQQLLASRNLLVNAG